MVAIYPHSTRLYLARDVICLMGISRPNPGTQSIKGIIRNRNRICFIFKRSYVNHRIAEIIRYIRREIKRPLEVQQLAKKSCMSISHFTRIFKQEVGVSPVEFIKQERIRIAVLLLKQPGISIKEVYTACGFDSRSYFNHVFKQYKKQTTKAFQQSTRLSPTTS